MVHLIPGIETASAGLNAQRLRMEVVSQNIANANTTRGPGGNPYQRKQVSFESVLQQSEGMASAENIQSVRVSNIHTDNTSPRMVHIPGHPDADSSGMVAFPNVNVHEEMVDLISASRAYEANLSVVRNARELANQDLMIGRA
jgi:flagellar basal-body rod protein FlgC